MRVPTLTQRIDAARTRLNLIAGMRFRDRHPLDDLRFRPLRPPGYRQPLLAEAAADWTPIAPGSLWGEWQMHFALRGGFRIPDTWLPPAAGTRIH